MNGIAPPIEIGSRLVFRWAVDPEVFRSFFNTVRKLSITTLPCSIAV